MSLLQFSFILLWLLVILEGWLIYQLLRQNGRTLLRLEALEGRAAAPVAPPSTDSQTAQEGLAVGAPAPPFDLPGLNGGRATLEQFRGRRVLLVFFDPSCGFCQQMAPELAALPFDRSDGRPLPVIITTRALEQNQRFFSEHGIRCPVLWEEGREVAARYRARGTPMGYLIDEQGKITSEIAVGAQAVLQLADAPESAGGAPSENGHKKAQKTRKPSLAGSRINREGLSAGTPAPIFRLPRLGGGELSLAEYRGRRVLLVFSDPQCGPCDALAPKLEALHRRHAPELQIITISRGEPEANRQKAAAHGLTFPIVLQRHWEISREYGMFATPIGYLIDERGIVAADVAVGADKVLDLAASALAGKAERKEETLA